MDEHKYARGIRTSSARQYLEETLKLNPGEKTFYPCVDKADQERMRVIFSTERKKMEKEEPDAASLLRITKSDYNGEIGIMVTRFSDEATVLIIRADGSEAHKRLFSVPREEIAERVCAILEEGISLEYLAEHLRDFFPIELFPSTIELTNAVKWAWKMQIDDPDYFKPKYEDGKSGNSIE